MQFHPPKHQPVNDLHNKLIYSIQRICMCMSIPLYMCIYVYNHSISVMYIHVICMIYIIFSFIYIYSYSIFLCIHIYVYVHVQNTSVLHVAFQCIDHQHQHRSIEKPSRYLEINVAGFRKLLKRHEKQVRCLHSTTVGMKTTTFLWHTSPLVKGDLVNKK